MAESKEIKDRLHELRTFSDISTIIVFAVVFLA